MYTSPMRLDFTPLNDLDIPGVNHVPADAFGVEVELEGENIRTAAKNVNTWWTIHPDNSLRAHAGDCLEYVFSRPYDFKDTQEAIDILFDFLNGPKVKVSESYRTSIHVHINMAKETYRTIFNYMTLCIIFDELLVSQNGDHRIGNNFCLRAKDAVGQIVDLITSVQNGHFFYNIHKNNRYSSINFASLTKFGTIEFRSLECTIHKGRVMHWINTLARLKEFAKTFQNPTEIVQKFSQMGPLEFLSKALGPYAMKYVQVPQASDMLHSGMRLAQDFAYCSSWTNYGEEVKGLQVPPPPKKKPMPKIKMNPYGNIYGNLNNLEGQAAINPAFNLNNALNAMAQAQGQPQPPQEEG